MTLCGIYIRKSREERDKDSHRLTVQREMLPEYARAQGWEVAIYDDGHASAARGKAEDLVERGRLERDIRAGRVQVVLCIELARLSRDDSMQDYVRWLDLCSELRVTLAIPGQSYNPADPDQWTMLIMAGGFSSREMKVLTARMKEGRDEALRAGKWISGNPPLGYRYDKAARGLIIDPAQHARILRIFQLAETSSARAIAEQLGLPLIAVRRAIADDRLLIYQGKRRLGDDIVTGQWPALLSPEQAERIRANRRNGYSGYVRREYAGLLSNLGQLLVCGYCGRALRAQHGRTRQSDGKRLDYYACQDHHRSRCTKSRFIPQVVLDNKIVEHVFKTLANLDTLRAWWQAAQTDGDDGEQLRRIEQGIVDQQARKQRLIAAISDGVIDFADAKQKRQEIAAAIDDLQHQQADLLARRHTPPDWDALTLSRAEFDVLDATDQREFLSAILRHVRVYHDQTRLEYKFPRNASGATIARIPLPEAKTGTGPGRKPLYVL